MDNAAKVVAPELLEETFGTATNPTREVVDLATRFVRGVKYVADLEAKLKEAKARLRELSEQQLPTTMLYEGCRELKVVHNGEPVIVQLQSVVHAKIPKYRQDEAMQYLEDHGLGEELIKTEVTVAFDKKDFKEAKEFYDGLKEDGFAPAIKRSVHAQTLKAWARREVPKGVQLDLELLGVYVGNKAIVVGHEGKEEDSGEE